MENLSKLSERLAELMTEQGLKPLDLAQKIGVSRNTVTRYLQGERLPSFETFIKLLEALQCSADCLLGLVDFPPEHVVFHAVPPFCERFRALMKEYGMSQYRLHQKTRLSYDNFNAWLKGTRLPYIDNLIKLAKAFDCSVDYLIGRVL